MQFQVFLQKNTLSKHSPAAATSTRQANMESVREKRIRKRELLKDIDVIKRARANIACSTIDAHGATPSCSASATVSNITAILPSNILTEPCELEMPSTFNYDPKFTDIGVETNITPVVHHRGTLANIKPLKRRIKPKQRTIATQCNLHICDCAKATPFQSYPSHEPLKVKVPLNSKNHFKADRKSHLEWESDFESDVDAHNSCDSDYNPSESFDETDEEMPYHNIADRLYLNAFQEVNNLKKLHKPAWLRDKLRYVDTKDEVKDIYSQKVSPEMENVQLITDLYISPLKKNVVNTDTATNLPGARVYAYKSGCSIAKCSGDGKRSTDIRKTKLQLDGAVSEPVLEPTADSEKHSFSACAVKMLPADIVMAFFTFDAFYSRVCHESQQRRKLQNPKSLHAQVQLSHDLGISHLKCTRLPFESKTSLTQCHRRTNPTEDFQQERKRRTLHEQNGMFPSNAEKQCSASSHKNKAKFCSKGSCKDGMHSKKRKRSRKPRGNVTERKVCVANFLTTSVADSVSKLEEPVQLPTEKSCDSVDECSNDSFISCILLSPVVSLSGEARTTKQPVRKLNQRKLTGRKRRESQNGLSKCADGSQLLQSGRDRSKQHLKDTQHGRKTPVIHSVDLKRNSTKTIVSRKSSRGKAKSLKTNESIQCRDKMSNTKCKAKVLKVNRNRNCHISGRLNITTKALAKTKEEKRRLESLGVNNSKRRRVAYSTKEDNILHHHQTLCTPSSTNLLFFSLTPSQDMFAQLCQLEEKSKQYDSNVLHSLMPRTPGNIYKRGPPRLKEQELQGNSHIGGVWKSIISEN